MEKARERAARLLPKIHAWHKWFFAARDPQNTGLVAIIHPWESGRDNSVDWDIAFERVPTDGVAPFTRRDTSHANPAHRPTDEQYKRYIWLVEHFRSLGWDNMKLHDASPFRIVDPGFNAILIRSCIDLADLAQELGQTQIAADARRMAQNGIAALDTLWSDAHGQYLCYDRAITQLIQSASIAGILACFAPIPAEKSKAIAQRIEYIAKSCEYLVPSHDPTTPDFDGLRYWRGPVWLIVNYMIADGLKNAGQLPAALRIMRDSVGLIEKSGFAEYYDPYSAEPCGGGQFTWTAAMVIEILKTQDAAA